MSSVVLSHLQLCQYPVIHLLWFSLHHSQPLVILLVLSGLFLIFGPLIKQNNLHIRIRLDTLEKHHEFRFRGAGNKTWSCITGFAYSNAYVCDLPLRCGESLKTDMVAQRSHGQHNRWKPLPCPNFSCLIWLQPQTCKWAGFDPWKLGYIARNFLYFLLW